MSGGDYGFREGTGKWPVSYPDTLPPAINVGLGCPTGVKFGTGSNFPAEYRRALFALDWTFGRILAVHLDERGASFTGGFEIFLRSRPLNVTAISFGRDGALYFITDGRKTRSALYRVRYTGNDGKGDSTVTVNHAVEERRSLESLHGKESADGVGKAWPGLGGKDRFVRNAARIVLESQPIAEWNAKALSENEPALHSSRCWHSRAVAVRQIARRW